MHRLTLSRYLQLAVIALTSVGWSSAGGAAMARRLTWWIEIPPSTCSAEADPLARQVQLACDATGRCAITTDERAADRRAVLVCDDDDWTLEARDARNQLLWTLALGRTDDDARLRQAGVWIARSEGQAPLDLPPPTTATTTRFPIAPRSLVMPEQSRAAENPNAAHLSLAAMLHGASPRSNTNDYGMAWGGRALLMGSAPHTTGPLIFGVAGTVEHASEKTDYTFIRGGLALGLGASAGAFHFGLLVEGGPAYLQLPRAPSDGSGNFGPQYVSTHSNLGVWVGYAEASLFGQWSLRGPIQPFLSPSVTWTIDHGANIPTQWIPNEIVCLDVGFVWGHM